MPNATVENQTVNSSNTNQEIREVISHYIKYWPYFILSTIICIGISFTYLYFTQPEYKVSSKILIQDDKKSQNINDIAIFKDLGISNSSNIDNEIEILKSRTLLQAVTDSLNLNIEYYSLDNFKKAELYGDSLSINIRIVNFKQPGSFTITPIKDNKLQIESVDFESTTTYDSHLKTPLANLLYLVLMEKN